ncbi:hypothetical protein CXB51_036530 [Gossypium anomalum]|uniref:Uncharacterized protein n=1 Tax=Gossypium anomalum TaxID=47600 RepID=A0A8J6CIH8_9ROSI|nr:hypothetical protein CXB51_036530 [Gossypium anomalum]
MGYGIKGIRVRGLSKSNPNPSFHRWTRPSVASSSTQPSVASPSHSSAATNRLEVSSAFLALTKIVFWLIPTSTIAPSRTNMLLVYGLCGLNIWKSTWCSIFAILIVTAVIDFRGRGRTLLKDLYDLNPIERVKERFALEVSDDYIKKALGQKWRDHKSTLKKQYFKKDISLEEKLRNVPPGMLRYQWEDAVRFWNSKKGEDRERVGTSSKQIQKFTHTAGSRSFASVAEAEEVSFGQKVGRLQLFEIMHRKKDGSPMISEAGEIMKLKEKKAEYEVIASTDSSVNLENIDNRIITEVLGPKRYDRVRIFWIRLPTIHAFRESSLS